MKKILINLNTLKSLTFYQKLLLGKKLQNELIAARHKSTRGKKIPYIQNKEKRKKVKRLKTGTQKREI